MGTQCTSRVAVWLQQLTQCTSGSGAVHEENKRENPQQVVHSFVQVALGEQCEDGRRVREVDKDGRSVRGVKHIRLRRGAPARKSSRPSKSADREGCARSAESESQSESEKLHFAAQRKFGEETADSNMEQIDKITLGFR